MWKKVLYIAVVIILGIVFFMMSYMSNYSAYQVDVVSNAIETKEYYKIPELFLDYIPMDKEPSSEIDNDTIDFVSYPVVGEIGFQYNKDEETTVTESSIEYAYYFYLFDINYTVGTQETSAGQAVNKSAIRFINGESYYDYFLVVNSTVNSDVYKDYISSVAEYLFNSERDLVKVIDSWGFVPSVFSETAIEYIKSQIGGDITKIAFTDAFGEVKQTMDISLDFSEAFFTHSYISEHKSQYNSVLNQIATESAAGNSDKAEELREELNGYLEDFISNFDENTKDTTFIVTPTQKDKLPNSIFWQSVGMLGLFLLAMIIIYVVIFHFNKLKQLFSKAGHRDYSAGVNKNKKTNIVNSKPTPKNEDVAEKVEAEKVVEENTIVQKAEEVSLEAKQDLEVSNDNVVEDSTTVENE